MKVVRKINNNVAIGLDNNEREIVLFGKGIGFPAMPYELRDLSKIDRTFYDVDERYYKLIEEVDTELLNFVDYLVDVVKSKIKGNWDKNLTFILADHINFSIIRMNQGMKIDFPYSYEIETEFPAFNKCAKWIVDNINKKMNVYLSQGEITCVAMHLMSAHSGKKKDGKETQAERTARILNSVIKIIEECLNISIDKKSIDFYRFRYHIQYFVKRKENSEEISDGNPELYESVKTDYPNIFRCAKKIEDFLEKEFSAPCSRDEILYLMIHINRLCSKEDCNRKGITPE